MKKNKKFVYVLLFFLMAAVVGVAPKQEVHAAKKNVTKTFKDKKKVNKLVGEFRDLLGYYSVYGVKKGKSKSFDYSKDSHRRKMMEYTYFKHMDLSSKKQKSLSKKLFGKSISKKVTQTMGDWGCYWPVLKVSKIYKYSKTKYQVNVTVYFDDDMGERTKEGTAVFTLKKSKNAKYDYYVTKVKITSTR